MPSVAPSLSTLQGCTACPRLVAFLQTCRAAEPSWHNGPVAPWGPADAPLLIVGLAPGRSGANRTGRPFSGDPSGDWLQQALRGAERLVGPPDEPRLVGVRITNAVKCVPPGNRPTAAERNTCRERFLRLEIGAPVEVILALGRIAHEACVRAAGRPPSTAPFGHGVVHRLRVDDGRDLVLVDSYHPSPLNTRTGRMSRPAFEEAVGRALAAVGPRPPRGQP